MRDKQRSLGFKNNKYYAKLDSTFLVAIERRERKGNKCEGSFHRTPQKKEVRYPPISEPLNYCGFDLVR